MKNKMEILHKSEFLKGLCFTCLLLHTFISRAQLEITNHIEIDILEYDNKLYSPHIPVQKTDKDFIMVPDSIYEENNLGFRRDFIKW